MDDESITPENTTIVENLELQYDGEIYFYSGSVQIETYIPHGYGIVKNKNGEIIFTGTYFKGFRYGEGVEYEQDQIYIGGFERGFKHGEGVYIQTKVEPYFTTSVIMNYGEIINAKVHLWYNNGISAVGDCHDGYITGNCKIYKNGHFLTETFIR